MTTINSKLPDALFRQAKSIADREEISFDQFLALAVASQVSAWEVGEEFKKRAARGSWDRAREILSNAGDEEPMEEDRLN